MRDYEKLINVLRTMSEKTRGLSMLTGISGDGLPVLFDDSADAIEELLADVPKWISVEERLPDEWREVLTYSPIHSDEKNPHMIQLCWYIGFGKWRECQYGEIMEIPITHWMQLPEPPKEVE